MTVPITQTLGELRNQVALGSSKTRAELSAVATSAASALRHLPLPQAPTPPTETHLETVLLPTLTLYIDLLVDVMNAYSALIASDPTNLEALSQLTDPILDSAPTLFHFCQEMLQLVESKALPSTFSTLLNALYKKAILMLKSYFELLGRSENTLLSSFDANALDTVVSLTLVICRAPSLSDTSLLNMLWKCLLKLVCRISPDQCSSLQKQQISAIVDLCCLKARGATSQFAEAVHGDQSHLADYQKRLAKHARFISFFISHLTKLVTWCSSQLIVANRQALSTILIELAQYEGLLFPFPADPQNGIAQVNDFCALLLSQLCMQKEFLNFFMGLQQPEFPLGWTLCILTLANQFAIFASEVQLAALDPDRNLVELIFKCVRLNTSALVEENCALADTNVDASRGKLFKRFLSSFCSLVVSMPHKNFVFVEQTLFTYVVSTNIHESLLAMESWMFCASVQDASVTQQHAEHVMHLILSCEQSSHQSSLSILLANLLSVLPQSAQTKLVEQYLHSRGLRIWSLTPLDRLFDSTLRILLPSIANLALKASMVWRLAKADPNRSDMEEITLMVEVVLRALCRAYEVQHVHDFLADTVHSRLGQWVIELCESPARPATATAAPPLSVPALSLAVSLLHSHAFDLNLIILLFDPLVKQLKAFPLDMQLRYTAARLLGACAAVELPVKGMQTRVLELWRDVCQLLFADKDPLLRDHIFVNFWLFLKHSKYSDLAPQVITPALQAILTSYVSRVPYDSADHKLAAAVHSSQAQRVCDWTMLLGQAGHMTMPVRKRSASTTGSSAVKRTRTARDGDDQLQAVLQAVDQCSTALVSMEQAILTASDPLPSSVQSSVDKLIGRLTEISQSLSAKSL